MTIKYKLLKSPLEPGDFRQFTNLGNDTISGQIRCFVSKPPPPAYKPCDACGSFKIHAMDNIFILADESTFSEFGGSLIIEISDSTGNSERIELSVNRKNQNTPGSDENGSSGSGGLEKEFAEEEKSEVDAVPG